MKTWLVRQEFWGLSDVPPETKRFNNIENLRIPRAYQIDTREFMQFVGITAPGGKFRQVMVTSGLFACKPL